MKKVGTYPVTRFLSKYQIKKYKLENAVCFHSLESTRRSETLQIEGNPELLIKHIGFGRYRVIKSNI